MKRCQDRTFERDDVVFGCLAIIVCGDETDSDLGILANDRGIGECQDLVASLYSIQWNCKPKISSTSTAPETFAPMSTVADSPALIERFIALPVCQIGGFDAIYITLP